MPYILSTQEVHQLLKLSRKLDRPPFRALLYRALLLLLYCTGVRFGEALRLRMRDVDIRAGVLFVEEFKGRARWVPFHRSLSRELENPDDRFFVSANHRTLPKPTAWKTLRKLFQHAGLKPARGRVGPRPYDWRHTFAVHWLTRWYRQGVDLHARLPWLSAYMGQPGHPGTESLEDIQAEAVLSFLGYVETQRRNSATSRNSRLAALRSFAQHLLQHDIARVHQYGRILAIPSKRAPVRVVSFLEPQEARAVIAAVEARTPLAARDRALLLFLYNTGARVSEALAVHARQLRLDRPRQVRLFGQGGKERVCPLWPETAAALRQLVRTNAADQPLFRNVRGTPLTRDGVAYLLDKYVQRASETHSSLRNRHVTPHTMRYVLSFNYVPSGVSPSGF